MSLSFVAQLFFLCSVGLSLAECIAHRTQGTSKKTHSVLCFMPVFCKIPSPGNEANHIGFEGIASKVHALGRHVPRPQLHV